MVTSIARQSVVIKCLRRKSVLLGNYEFFYLAGLMKKLYQIPVHEDMSPKEMSETILKELDQLEPKDDREEYLIELVRYYEPLSNEDDQMKELFRWGENEQCLWQVNSTQKLEN